MKRIVFLLACALLFLSCSKKASLPVRMQRNLPDTAYDDSFVMNSKSLASDWEGSGYNAVSDAAGIEGATPPVYSDISKPN